jgi:hypothetical protein
MGDSRFRVSLSNHGDPIKSPQGSEKSQTERKSIVVSSPTFNSPTIVIPFLCRVKYGPFTNNYDLIFTTFLAMAKVGGGFLLQYIKNILCTYVPTTCILFINVFFHAITITLHLHCTIENKRYLEFKNFPF